MVPMMGMAEIHRQDVYCGQCFEEFYGQEYCQNLRKDLEKLKDEFYDSDSQRFWFEWVVPTVNLLRRLSFMGFPLRTKDFVLVHLYNPVDSMAMGELHFQVGRKAPGTLTLKFTKQNASGAFVIQPKTLSNAEEMKLSSEPLGFFDYVRSEMRETAVEASNAMQVLVLMTDSCKLQRQCANAFFGRNKNERFMDRGMFSGREPVSMFYQSTTSNVNPPISINPWVPNMNVASFHPEASIRPSMEGNFHPPWNFCVKNYVNYGAKTPTAELSLHGGQPFSPGHIRQIPRKASLTVRQVSTTTCHSEPEESDETLKPHVGYESPQATPAERMAELQRRMSDAKLWDPPPKVRPTTQPIPATSSPQASRSQTRVTEEYAGGQPVPEVTLPRSFSNDANRLAAPPSNNSRRHSEPKISLVEEYCMSGQTKSEEQRVNKMSMNDRTSLTEEYAQEQRRSVPEVHDSQSIPTQMPRLEVNYGGSGGSRTDLVDSYIGEHVSSGSSESRSRTSSLDAYVGEKPTTQSLQATHLAGNLVLPTVDPRQKSNSCENLKPLAAPFVQLHPGNVMAYGPHDAHLLMDGNRRHMVDSWVYQQPNGIDNGMLMSSVGPDSSPDMSLMSQSTFPSWGSHRDYQPANMAPPLIPLVVEKINRGDYQSWDHLKSNPSSSISS